MLVGFPHPWLDFPHPHDKNVQNQELALSPSFTGVITNVYYPAVSKCIKLMGI